MTKSFKLIGILSVAIFLVIWGCVSYGHMASFDTDISGAFYNIRSAGLTSLMQIITYIGNWQGVVIILMLLLIYPETRYKYGIFAFSSVVIAQIVKTLIKEFVKRPRPAESLHLIVQHGYSFPSGHAITAMALFGALFILLNDKDTAYSKRIFLMTVTAMMPILIGISRIYLGVHYPSDVLAGWVGGIATVCMSILVVNAWLKRRKKYE